MAGFQLKVDTTTRSSSLMCFRPSVQDELITTVCHEPKNVINVSQLHRVSPRYTILRTTTVSLMTQEGQEHSFLLIDADFLFYFELCSSVPRTYANGGGSCISHATGFIHHFIS